MTYPNDPNLRTPNDPNLRTANDPNLRTPRAEIDRTSNTGVWIAGAVAAFFIVGIVLYALSGGPDTTASNRPAANTPATTTGSGASTPPNNPNGTAPQRDMNQPAPAPQAPAPKQ